MASFNNYNILQAPYAHYNEIFINDIDPDPNQQTLNESIFYIGYAFSKMIDDGNTALYSNLASNINFNNELLLKNFFDLYPQHYQDVKNIIDDDFQIDIDPLVQSTFEVGSKPYGLSVYIPENTFKESESVPVVAMSIELTQPDSTTIVNQGEYGNDYYDDDDFIPCFYKGQEIDTYQEATIGYDDYNDHLFNKKSYSLAFDPVTAVIVVGVAVVVGTAGVWLFGDLGGNNNIDPETIVGDGDPGSGTQGGCTPATNLGCVYAKYDNRYQRRGKSRIRYKIYPNHPLDIRLRGWDQKKRVANVKKNQFPKIINSVNGFEDDFYFNGYSFNTLNSISPVGYSFFAITYEHDWHRSNKWFVVEDPGTGLGFELKGHMRSRSDIYQQKLVRNFDWCLNGDKVYNGSGGTATLEGL